MNGTEPTTFRAQRKTGKLALAYFLNSRVRAGTEEHLLTLLRGVDRNSFRPHLIAPPELCEQLRPDCPGDVEMYPLYLGKPTDGRAMTKLRRFLRTREIQVLHSHLFHASLFASPIGRLSGVPVVIETPHLRERWRKGWVKGSYVWDRMVGRLVDYYIAVSQANAGYLIEEKRLNPRKVVVIRNGRDLARFVAAPAVRTALRQRLGLSEQAPVLSVVGRLEPQKGHGVLLDALPAIRKEFPNLQVFFIGEGALREKLHARIQDQGLSACVHITGFQSDVVPWLAFCDVFVLPSLFEGLPLVAIEALAMEKAVVATEVDGTPEVVIHGQTGLAVPPGNADRLAAAVCDLLRDPARRQLLGRSGRKHVLDCFDERRQVELTQALYTWSWESRVGAASGQVASLALPDLLRGHLQP